MNETKYQYDVAFSFCSQDEALALNIAATFSDSISTFIYSQQQKEIAGKDGEIEFSRVFGETARIVVVLYREEWGNSPWTRIEQTAIRGRAFEHGYDFVLFVPVQEPVELPKWVPKQQLWLGLNRFGLPGITSIIEKRVSDFGGNTVPLTPEESARKQAKLIALRRKNAALLNTAEGVKLASEEFQKFKAELLAALGGVAAELGPQSMRIDDTRHDTTIYSGGYVLNIEWENIFVNSLDAAGLIISLYRKHRDIHAKPLNRLARHELKFAISDVGSPHWRENSERVLTTSDAVKLAMTLLLDRIAQGTGAY